MKVIRFPQMERAGEELDALLDGTSAGAEGVELRELRAEVRSLAAPVDHQFECELQARVREWGREAQRTRRGRVPSLGATIARLARGKGRGPRWIALGGAGAVLCGLAIAIVVFAVSPQGGTMNDAARFDGTSAGSAVHRSRREDELGPAQTAEERTASAPANGSAAVSEAAVPSTTEAARRLQRHGASVTLATSRADVQSAAEAVMRLAVADGGYVESSQVQQRASGTSEAGLTLSLPSAKLPAAIASLGRIAAVRDVSQESQDITSSYDSVRRRLGDAEAVRHALLRALSAASTEGRIDSLREQLSSNRETIARERAALKAVQRRASTSQLTVSIAGGDKAAASAPTHEGLTLRRGLRDAGHVLAGAGAVLLIAVAALVPLALIAFVADMLWRAWLRRRREAALEP